jgi:hypothetical protein
MTDTERNSQFGLLAAKAEIQKKQSANPKLITKK